MTRLSKKLDFRFSCFLIIDFLIRPKEIDRTAGVVEAIIRYLFRLDANTSQSGKFSRSCWNAGAVEWEPQVETNIVLDRMSTVE